MPQYPALSDMLYEAAERGYTKLEAAAREQGWLYTAEAIRGYLFDGRTPSDFLCGVLAGDLYLAATSADAGNAKNLANIAKAVYHYLPRTAFGSQAKVEKWIEAVNERRHQEWLEKKNDHKAYVLRVQPDARGIWKGKVFEIWYGDRLAVEDDDELRAWATVAQHLKQLWAEIDAANRHQSGWETNKP